MMPITPLDAITFANQNMHVPASKQNDYRSRIEGQKYALVAAMAEKETSVMGLDELKEDQKVDGDREHNRQESEEQTDQKPESDSEKDTQKKEIKVEEVSTKSRHILDIKV